MQSKQLQATFRHQPTFLAIKCVSMTCLTWSNSIVKFIHLACRHIKPNTVLSWRLLFNLTFIFGLFYQFSSLYTHLSDSKPFTVTVVEEVENRSPAAKVNFQGSFLYSSFSILVATQFKLYGTCRVITPLLLTVDFWWFVSLDCNCGRMWGN